MRCVQAEVEQIGEPAGIGYGLPGHGVRVNARSQTGFQHLRRSQQGVADGRRPCGRRPMQRGAQRGRCAHAEPLFAATDPPVCRSPIEPPPSTGPVRWRCPVRTGAHPHVRVPPVGTSSMRAVGMCGKAPAVRTRAPLACVHRTYRSAYSVIASSAHRGTSNDRSPCRATMRAFSPSGFVGVWMRFMPPGRLCLFQGKKNMGFHVGTMFLVFWPPVDRRGWQFDAWAWAPSHASF